MSDEQKPGGKIDLQPAIIEARQERSRPLRMEKLRKELKRLIRIYAWLTALLESQEPNIRARRELEKLESTVFVNRKSIDVEMSRERVQEHHRYIWEQIEALVDLVSRPDKNDG